jgi:hypothetical protein
MVNLLLVENEAGEAHYIYIKKLERLLHTCTTGYYKDRKFCPFCSKTVSCCDETFEEHLLSKHFSTTNNCNLELPTEGTSMSFTNHKDKMERPFMVYADWECSLIKTHEEGKTHRHIANSCAFYFVCTFDKTRNQYYSFEGEQCTIEMVAKLKALAKTCIAEMKENTKMELSEEEELTHQAAETCMLCNGGFGTEKPKWKVRDHDHRTGDYRGACHNSCNINFFQNRYLPVFVHNLRGYDAHLILKEAYDVVDKKERISVIPQSTEKFMTFSIGDLKFKDSFQFMAEGLETLAKALKQEKGDVFEKYTNMKQHFNEEDMKIICQKGIYPYEWMDDKEKFKQEHLPARREFKSKLKLAGVTNTEYKHAQRVWKHFKCKTFQDYHDLYLKCDVLLLADIFENFRKTSIEHYKLDPANFITAASYAWSAMLLKTGVELELISDPKILDIFERSKRGGLTFVGSKRYAKANNQHVAGYDPNTQSTYLLYLDANNLYGWAMVQSLPRKDLKFANETSIETILNTADDAETGYMVEIDIKFKREIHESLKQMPPCPESLTPKEAWFSDYQKQLQLQTKSNTKCAKLVPHLREHLNYCIHYRNLKFIEKLGVTLGKVHNVISFTQDKWMKPYIEGNNERRTLAAKSGNKFEKDFFKLMNNAVFGKTMENVRNRMNLHLTTDHANAINWFSKPEFKTNTNAQGLYLIETHKTRIVYDKPVYVGCAVLDLSKLHMLDFHYNVIQAEFGDKAKLIYSDTDSYVYEIESPNIYDWIKENREWFDLSGSKREDMRDSTNESKLGKFKDELHGQAMTEFIALNPKCYAFRFQKLNQQIEEIKKAKGVSYATVKHTLPFKEYEKVLEKGNTTSRIITNIGSFNQQLFSFNTDKIALNAFYDKMKLLDKINCEPFGFNEGE